MAAASTADDVDVEIVGETGVNHLRDSPHARFACINKPFPRTTRRAARAPPPLGGLTATAGCAPGVDQVQGVGRPLRVRQLPLVGRRTREARRKRQQAELAVRKAAEKGLPVPSSGGGRGPRCSSASARRSRRRTAASRWSAADSARQEEREARAEDDEVEDLFADYTPAHFQGGQPHPDPIVETTSLSFAALPPITYQLKLPGASSGRGPPTSPSAAPSRPHSSRRSRTRASATTRLPSGERAGFFLGDGVGLGKGRQLAGLIYESWLRGRTRHLWVSVSADLAVDAERDLRDIGAGDAIKVYNITKLPLSAKGLDAGKHGIKSGVIFSTYAALTSGGKDGSKHVTRLEQIVKWLGGDGAEGCLLFDEAHKAKNLVPSNEDAEQAMAADAAGVGGGAARGGAASGFEQEEHEDRQGVPGHPAAVPVGARVVYCSATGASSLSNFAYMERLGLWGPGTAFPAFDAFHDAIGKGGVGAMELVALDMKQTRHVHLTAALVQVGVVRDARDRPHAAAAQALRLGGGLLGGAARLLLDRARDAPRQGEAALRARRRRRRQAGAAPGRARDDPLLGLAPALLPRPLPGDEVPAGGGDRAARARGGQERRDRPRRRRGSRASTTRSRRAWTWTSSPA